jgi:hypothetical protein
LLDFDPESLNPHGEDEELRDVDVSAARGHYVDVG